MQLGFTSFIDTSPAAAQNPGGSPGILRPVLTAARLAEIHNFDRVLVPEATDLSDPRADPCWLGGFLLQNTTSLSLAVAHRVDSASPIAAAEKLASLDRRCEGRLSIRVADPASDTGHEASLARTDEYLTLLKRLWTNTEPFDHEGPFYSLRGGCIASRPFNETGVPFVLGGVSGTAIKIAARHADVFVMSGSTPGEVHQVISRVLAAAGPIGRAAKIGFAIDIKPIVAATQAEADRRAAASTTPLDADLVGTPDRIALALLRYCEIGVSRFVVHGLSGEDIALFGEAVIPLVRRSVDRAGVSSGAGSFYDRLGRTPLRTGF